MIDKTRDSYNLDLFSQAISTAALADQDYARVIWEKVRLERRRLGSNLRQLNLSLTDSESNFLLAEVTRDLPVTARELYLALKQQHILVRYFDVPGLDDKLRITIGTPGENDHLLTALRKILLP